MRQLSFSFFHCFRCLSFFLHLLKHHAYQYSTNMIMFTLHTRVCGSHGNIVKFLWQPLNITTTTGLRHCSRQSACYSCSFLFIVANSFYLQLHEETYWILSQDLLQGVWLYFYSFEYESVYVVYEYYVKIFQR